MLSMIIINFDERGLWRRSLTCSHKRTSMVPCRKLLERLQQVHCRRRRLLRRRLEFHVCTINKSVHTKKVWKLIACSSCVCMCIYIYIMDFVCIIYIYIYIYGYCMYAYVYIYYIYIIYMRVCLDLIKVNALWIFSIYVLRIDINSHILNKCLFLIYLNSVISDIRY